MASSDPSSNQSKHLFDDIFHTFGDDEDLHLDETVDFDDLFIEWESKNELKVMHSDDPVAVEEQRLSQKLSQLVATNKRPFSSQPTDDSTMKKMKHQTTLSIETIPPYLRAKQKLFDQTMNHFIQKSSNSITMDDFREIAVLIHDITFTNLLISQWQTYLLAGTGQLKISFVHPLPKSTLMIDVSIWSNDVKKKMIHEQVVIVDNETDIDPTSCLTFTESYLQQLRDRALKLQTQLNERKHHLNSFTPQMERVIEQFVFQHYMNEAELRIQNKILIVEFDYRDRLLDLKFESLKPSDQQSELYRKFYQAHCEYEQSKFNVDILKQYVFYKEFPDSFDSFRLSLPIEFESISDQSMRQTLQNRYQRIVQQTKSDMMLIHVSVAEVKLRECHEHMKMIQNDPVFNRDLTTEMNNVMQHRVKDYEERMRRLYQLKMNFFVKAPTVLEKNL